MEDICAKGCRESPVTGRISCALSEITHIIHLFARGLS